MLKAPNRLTIRLTDDELRALVALNEVNIVAGMHRGSALRPQLSTLVRELALRDVAVGAAKVVDERQLGLPLAKTKKKRKAKLKPLAKAKGKRGKR